MHCEYISKLHSCYNYDYVLLHVVTDPFPLTSVR